MTEKFTNKFTNTTLGDQTGEVTESLLLSDFVEHRYLTFAQEHKRSWKTNKGNLECHVLPHPGASHHSDISTDTLMAWVRTLELIGLSYSSRFRLFRQAKSILHSAVQWGVLRISIGLNQRDLRTILGHYKPETLALVRNNSFESNVRA